MCTIAKVIYRVKRETSILWNLIILLKISSIYILENARLMYKITFQEYEFLDLTDINEEERSSLTSALFASAPTRTPIASGNWPAGDKVDSQVAWTDPNYGKFSTNMKRNHHTFEY